MAAVEFTASAEGGQSFIATGWTRHEEAYELLNAFVQMVDTIPANV